MASIRSFQRSFAGGEVTPELFGRIDDAKFQSGLALCRNFITKPHGPAENRAGFAYVRETRASHLKSRLIPFTYSTTQTMVLEFGNGYLRFHTQGATLLAGSPAAYNGATAYAIGDMVTSAGTKYYCIAATTGNAPPNVTYWYALPSDAYEIPTPYTETALFDIHYVQSADVLTLVHPDYPPAELRRMGATKWVLSNINFASPISAPTGVTATATGHTAVKYDYSYVVTAIYSDDISESVASSVATDGGNLFETGGIVTIAWSAVSGATKYNVYKLSGGLYGYIGQTAATSMVDDNVKADLSKTPPLYEVAFTGTGNYPAAVSYFEQRRALAGTTNKPQNLWMTKSGTESNLSYSFPIRDDERISFRVAAREANTIRHILPMGQLILLTSAAEWRVTSQNSDAITPTSISVSPQSYVGASNVQPQIVNNTAIYCASRGGHVRELGYSQDKGGYITGDLSLRAPHLFDGYELADMAFSKAPYPILWFISTSGYLVGLTYVPEQQVGAWHRHDTDGTFESCCVVAEGSEDVLYVIVNRTIGGVTKRYVERMATRAISDQEDAFFVDCGATYSGAPVDTISGLTWLEGKTVSILADGAVHPQRVVTGGAITLDVEASKVQIGLPITAEMQTLPMAAQIDNGFGQGRVKNVNRVSIRVYKSSGLFAGPTEDRLTEAKQRTTEPYGSPPELKSEEVEIVIGPKWSDGGQVFIRQADPLPLTVVSMTVEAEIGS
jgi:hypothetical protein